MRHDTWSTRLAARAAITRRAIDGDPRFAAAVQAFQMIGDTRDLWETIEIIDEMEMK